jgi:O-antigen/teichoic acid export membrane protein
LGDLSIRTVIILDFFGAAIRITFLILFLSLKLESLGILLSILCQFLVTSIIFTVLSLQKFGLHLKKESLKISIREGMSNFPIKISRTLQIYGGISILAFLGISKGDIAGFTISQSIFLFAMIIPFNLALIAIPSSTKEKDDLSYSSMRIGMGLTAPLITILVVSPTLILGIYDISYAKFSQILIILAISLIPLILSANVTTMLNNKGLLKKLSLLGIVESSAFLISILVLTPIFGAVGGAWAFVIAFSSSGILSLVWTDKLVRKVFFIGLTAIGLGITAGIIVQRVFDNDYASFVIAFFVTLSFLFILKTLTFSDISLMIQQFKKK